MKVRMIVDLDVEAIKAVGLELWAWKFGIAIEDWTDVFVAIASMHMLDGSYEEYVKGSKFKVGDA